MSALFLEVKGAENESLNILIAEAIELAKVLGITVKFTYNRVVLTVDRQDDLESVKEEYTKALENQLDSLRPTLEPKS